MPRCNLCAKTIERLTSPGEAQLCRECASEAPGDDPTDLDRSELDELLSPNYIGPETDNETLHIVVPVNRRLLGGLALWFAVYYRPVGRWIMDGWIFTGHPVIDSIKMAIWLAVFYLGLCVFLNDTHIRIRHDEDPPKLEVENLPLYFPGNLSLERDEIRQIFVVETESRNSVSYSIHLLKADGSTQMLTKGGAESSYDIEKLEKVLESYLDIEDREVPANARRRARQTFWEKLFPKVG